MLTQSLLKLLQRDLAALSREVEAYPDEALLWISVPGLPNCGGVLVRHIAGNLQHYVGAVLGRTGYLRDRPAEFNGAPWPRARLLSEIAATLATVSRVLPTLTEEQLSREYPELVAQVRVETADFLTHLVVHCGFHLGQVDYHRRAATGAPTSIAPMGITALASATDVTA